MLGTRKSLKFALQTYSQDRKAKAGIKSCVFDCAEKEGGMSKCLVHWLGPKRFVVDVCNPPALSVQIQAILSLLGACWWEVQVSPAVSMCLSPNLISLLERSVAYVFKKLVWGPRGFPKLMISALFRRVYSSI